MSTQKHIIEVIPPKYEASVERMTFRGYRCPACGGLGRHSAIADSEAPSTCTFCDGTGKVLAAVTIRWAPDYE